MALVVTPCKACGAPNADGQRFCGQCGTSLDDMLAGPAAGGAAERKLATVLFADVVGFTSLAERTDSELVARIVDAALRQLSEVVVDHGGTIDKYMGDSLMAVFGVPVAHDDDAERAVAAALAIRHLGGDLVFSIGINSGEVMATAIGRPGDITVIGDTVNVAARLEKTAAPGEVLCGRLTTELAGRRILFRPRQPVLARGKSEPMEVWEAMAFRPANADPADEETPLVGRDDELAFLKSAWRRVSRDRRAEIVLLCGDAGAGKTRLANELSRLAAADGTVVRSSCPTYGTMAGARVAADIVRQLGPSDDPEVEVRLRSVAGDVDPSLRSLDLAALEQEQRWAFGRLLEEKGGERPLLIVIDDLHRSGHHTLDRVADIVARLHNVALLVLLAGRPEPEEWLGRFAGATTVRLEPLGRREAILLASAILHDKPLAPDTADPLVARANGNPLYLRELVGVARRTGSLVDHGDSYHLATNDAIPPTLQALLAARLDALETRQKLVYQHVAVLGDGATEQQIAALGPAGVPEALGALVECGLLRIGHDGGYESVDSLLREVAYETLPRSLRGDLHQRAAGIVTDAAGAARHLERAADYLPDDVKVVAEAAEALADVGLAYARASRHLEALALLGRAVDLGCRRPPAVLELATLQTLTGDADEALQTLSLVEDDPGDPSVAVERDHIAANARSFSDPAWALPRLLDVAERWRSLRRPEKEAWAHANAGVACFNLSRMSQAVAELERALAGFDEVNDPAGHVAASSFLCLAHPTDKRVPGWLVEALDFADATGDRYRQAAALVTLAWHHFLRSFGGGAEATAEAESFALRLARLAEELRADEFAAQGASLLGIMARLSGRLNQAAEWISPIRAVPDRPRRARPWFGWAAAFSVTVARGATGAAAPLAPEDSVDPVVGMAELIVATELAVAGRVDEALGRLEGAQEQVARQIRHLFGVLYALALVLAGRKAAARSWAQRAADAARALDAEPTAIAAAALLAEIDGDPTGLPPPPPMAGSIVDMLLLRAYVSTGGSSAAALRVGATALAMPGLLIAL